MSAMKDIMIQKMESAWVIMQAAYENVLRSASIPEKTSELHELMLDSCDLCMTLVMHCDLHGTNLYADYIDMLYAPFVYWPWECDEN